VCPEIGADSVWNGEDEGACPFTQTTFRKVFMEWFEEQIREEWINMARECSCCPCCGCTCDDEYSCRSIEDSDFEDFRKSKFREFELKAAKEFEQEFLVTKGED